MDHSIRVRFSKKFNSWQAEGSQGAYTHSTREGAILQAETAVSRAKASQEWLRTLKDIEPTFGPWEMV